MASSSIGLSCSSLLFNLKHKIRRLVGNVGNMLGRVGVMPTLPAKNRPMSNVADAVTEFMAGSCVGEPGSRVGSCS